MEAKNLTYFKTGILFILLVVALTAGAQKLDVPQKEFAIHLLKDRMELSREEGGQLDILILKSKGYQKSKIKMGVSSSLPKGVTVTFQPDTGSFDSTKANVLINVDATPGEYLLILSATLNYKTKGSILKLLVN